MHEDVLVGDRDPQPHLRRRTTGQRLGLGAQPRHPRIGERPQRRPDLGVARRDPERGLAHPRVGHGHEPEAPVQRAAGPERRQGRHQARDRPHRRQAVLGHPGMGRLAGEDDPHPPRRAAHRPHSERHLPQRQARHVVQGEGVVGRDLPEPRVGQHRGGPGPVLLRRLEQQDGPPARRSLTPQPQRQGGERRHVPVMAAEMRLARHSGAMRDRGDLLDRQPVELGAEHHGRPGCGTLVHGGDTVATQARDDPVGSCGGERALDRTRRLHLLPGQLGPAMQLAPPEGQLRNVAVGKEHRRLCHRLKHKAGRHLEPLIIRDDNLAARRQSRRHMNRVRKPK